MTEIIIGRDPGDEIDDNSDIYYNRPLKIPEVKIEVVQEIPNNLDEPERPFSD